MEQYNKAMETYKEALANAEDLDGKLSELSKAVQSAIAAAEGSFSYRTAANQGGGTDNAPSAAEQANRQTAGVTAEEADEIPDESVPLADGLSQIAGEEHSGNADEAETIADDEVPLAGAAKEQSGMRTVGIMGMFSALFAALLLLFKRKKDEEEEQSVQ